MQIQTLRKILTMCEWDNEVLKLALNDPVNRHATRVKHSCDDWHLFQYPELLVENFISTGALARFWDQYPSRKNIVCLNSHSCTLKDKCHLRSMNFYWKKCPVPGLLNCNKHCPPPEEIISSKNKRRLFKPQVEPIGLCITDYNMAQTVIIFTCPTNRNGALFRHGLNPGETGDRELFSHSEWLFEQFFYYDGKEAFQKSRSDFFLPLCDTYDECGVRKNCRFMYHPLFWRECPIRLTDCKGNCTRN